MVLIHTMKNESTAGCNDEFTNVLSSAEAGPDLL